LGKIEEDFSWIVFRGETLNQSRGTGSFSADKKCEVSLFQAYFFKILFKK
jgi:hypothetical protein